MNRCQEDLNYNMKELMNKITEQTFEERMKEKGYTSSKEKEPPFLVRVDIYEPVGRVSTVMYHEKEKDGYDFKKEVTEQRMCLHYIYDFKNCPEVWWKIHGVYK